MLALILVLTLAQCTKDTDCKGERICSGGQCVSAGSPRDGTVDPFAAPAPPPLMTSTSNPYRVHRWLAMGAAIGLWALTSIGSLAVGDATWPTTILPVLGPFISYLRIAASNQYYFQGAWGPVVLITSSVLQLGALAYLVAAIINEVNFNPNSVSSSGDNLRVSDRSGPPSR